MTEQQEQMNLIKWTQQPSVRKIYPELALLFHIPNERPDKVQAAILKKLGVKRGVPDLFLPVPSRKFHGLFIEMKNSKGRTSDSQLWWGEHLAANGYVFDVCHGWQEAVEVLTWYLNLRQA